MQGGVVIDRGSNRVCSLFREGAELRSVKTRSEMDIRFGLLLASIFAAMLVVLPPPEAAAVECLGDRDYDTAIADGCTSITGLLDIAYPSRTNIDGLAGLTSVGSSSIESALLENVDGFVVRTSFWRYIRDEKNGRQELLRLRPAFFK